MYRRKFIFICVVLFVVLCAPGVLLSRNNVLVTKFTNLPAPKESFGTARQGITRHTKLFYTIVNKTIQPHKRNKTYR